MRIYNAVAITKDKNPNLVNCFDEKAQVIQFIPGSGMKVWYPNKKYSIKNNIKVKKTFRYNQVQSEGRDIINCGDHAIIVTNNETFCLDIENDTM